MQALKRFGAGLTLAFALISSPSANAETLQRISSPDPDYDCRSELPTGGGIFDWRSTVALEHCARIVRLARISSALSVQSQPQFFAGFIEQWRLPANVGIRMPLLRVVFPERVFFDTDQVTLRPEAYEVIDIVARNLAMELPDVAMFVAGHADSRGSRGYNLDLSSRRANAIAEAISRRRGLRGASVWRVGFGEDMPLYAGNTDLALGYNRRIEFYFASKIEVLQVYIEEDLPSEICLGPNQRTIDDCRRDIVFEDGYVVREALPDVPDASVTVPRPSSPAQVQARGGSGDRVVPRTGEELRVVPRIPREIHVSPRVPTG